MKKNLFPQLIFFLLILSGSFACSKENDVQDPWPAARNSHASAFNSQTGELLIFGGSTADGEDNSLWSCKNGKWTLLSESGPEKREDALLVYHSKNDKSYLIGGRNFSPGTNFSDFWEWNGSAWVKLFDTTPFGSLTHATATYDEMNDRILVFGGLSSLTGALTSDLWSWNGIVWNKISTAGPSARLASALVYSPTSKKIYLFGGAMTNGTVFQQVWELDGETWTKIDEAMPAVMTPVAAMGNAFALFGGFKADGTTATETWIFGSTGWTSMNMTPPTPRALHSLSYDESNNCIWMFGGSKLDKFLDELWEFKNGTWHQYIRK